MILQMPLLILFLNSTIFKYLLPDFFWMSKEVIPIGCDHPAFHLKEELKKYLIELGFEPLDLGTFSTERVDYPVYALSVADKVSKGKYKRGIVLCKTGVGVSIVANKFPGIRAGLVTNVEVAELTKKHNNTNILALGAGFTSAEDAKKIVKTWLFTEPETTVTRHTKRVEQISTIEKHLIEGKHTEKTSELISSAVLNDTQGNNVKISASLMCANQMSLLDDVRKLIEAGIDLFHIDIIDGLFAQNISLSVDHVASLRLHTHLPIDVHLMVKNPRPYIPRLAEVGADVVIVHAESDAENLSATLNEIKERGMKPGLAVEVDTPLERIYPFIDKVSLVMFMAVHTGFKGSQFIPSVLEKIREFNSYKQQKNLPVSIMVDGSIGPRVLPHLYSAGARIFVGGTSGLFKDGTFKQNIEQMKSFCYEEMPE